MVVAARAMACIAALIVAIALTGYASHTLVLVNLHAGLRGMSPLTAAGLVSLSIATLACTWDRTKLAAAAAAVGATFGVIALGSYLFAGSELFSQPIGMLLFGLPEAAIGRTSIATATAMILVAAALLLRRARPAISDVIGGVSLVVAGTALLGYLYGVRELYALSMFNGMALNTAVALFLLSLAALSSEPDAGWAGVVASHESGGGATRRQLTFIALPVVAGWVLLRVSHAQVFGPSIAIALLVIVTAVPLAILILRDGRVLNALDRERRGKLELQQSLAGEMRDQLAAQATQLADESAERAKVEATMYRAQRMEAVGQLTGGIAHDFNNLLMAIRGNLELMQRRVPEGDPRLLRYLESAMTATDRGAKITGQLLAFSRSQRLNIRSVEADPVLHSARDLIGSSLGPQIELTIELDTAGAWIMADPDQLELALLNLAVNARDAMPEGGHIRIESASCSRRPSEERDDMAYVSIRVVDDGTGMSDDVVAKAVEPFFTTKEMGKGTGLGLAQVYGFVRQCRGDLRITSVLGKGTTIEILLPCGEPVEAVERRATVRILEAASANNTGRTVLVIDDDDAVRAVIVDALAAAGFEVVQASDGKRGLALLDEAHPAAAVIDFLMPGMNGAEVARLAQQRRPGLPIVFVSGYSDTVALEGITGAIVLRKPFDVGGLSRALNSVLH